MTEIAAIILAAGLARRFRETSGLPTKLVAELDGVAMVRRVAMTALASKARPVIVVTGHARDDVAEALWGLALTLVHNPAFADGLAGSLRQGLTAVPDGCAGAMVMLADMPRVTVATCNTLLDRFAAVPARTLAVVPAYHGQWGNPLVLGRALFADAARLPGDQGARKLLPPGRPGILVVPLDDPGVLADADTPDMLAAMER